MEDLPIETRTRGVRIEPWYGCRGFPSFRLDDRRPSSAFGSIEKWPTAQRVTSYHAGGRISVPPTTFLALADKQTNGEQWGYPYQLRAADMSIQKGAPSTEY